MPKSLLKSRRRGSRGELLELPCRSARHGVYAHSLQFPWFPAVQKHFVHIWSWAHGSWDGMGIIDDGVLAFAQIH